jgi:hypothetical protein
LLQPQQWKLKGFHYLDVVFSLEAFHDWECASSTSHGHAGPVGWPPTHRPRFADLPCPLRRYCSGFFLSRELVTHHTSHGVHAASSQGQLHRVVVIR